MTENKKTGGQAPFGFTWKSGELAQDPQEAPTYALLFDLFLVHQRKGAVAKLLNDQGLRTRAGKEFAFATIKRLLENPIAKGVHRSSVSTTDETGEQINTVVEKSVPPIVSVSIWDHVQAILSGQDGSQSRTPTQDLFVGMVMCHCGTLMELASKSSDYHCYKCEQKISKEDVLAIVEDQFSQLPLPDSDTLKKRATTSLVDQKNDPKRILKQIERDIEKLFSLHANDAITNKTFKERNTILEKRKKQLQSAQKTSDQPKEFSAFIDHWQSLKPNMKRILVENMIEKITIAPSEATVSLYPLYNFAQQASTSHP